MHTSACTWDNYLVDRKEEQIFDIIGVTKQDRLGYGRELIIRRDETCRKVFLAEVDPDFGSMDAALDRIELPID